MNIEGSATIAYLSSRLWLIARPHVAYICSLEKNLDDLRTSMVELKEAKNDMMRRVVNAEGHQMKRLEQVERWVSSVELMEVKVETLIKDASQESEKKCLCSSCPRISKRSYKLGKTAAEMLNDVANLKSRGYFKVVAVEQPLSPWEEMPSRQTVGLKSTVDEVWIYIEDDQAGIIGIYGVGGVGKTTLLIEINNKLCNTTHGFDFVIWITVSNIPNYSRVQEDIGRKIGLFDEVWKNKSQEDKASDIFRALKKKKFVLLLDEIWEYFDLLKVGIPLHDEQNKSKVVFTTRSEEVCGCMEVDRKTRVNSLAWEEAWDLFRIKVGEETLNSHPEIPKLAKNVARECNGLPIALITIGQEMACKTTPQEWHHAIAMSKKSGNPDMQDHVYLRLKVSYDRLQSDIVRSCFLYCFLFPGDELICKDRLVNYWISEGFLDGFDHLNEAQSWGHDVISTLIHASLLEEDSSSYVKMHGVIRGMALWIACECEEVKNKVLVRTGEGLKYTPSNDEKWKGVERISLMQNDIEKLIGTPSCPNLLTLLLTRNKLKMISRGFFQNMPCLRVLDLSCNGDLSELPMEISKLVSLRFLNLSWTNIRKLPIECKKLAELKYLHLEGTGKLDIIPLGVFSSFKKLRVLTMWSCGSFVKGDSGVEALVKEAEWLKELTQLTITIKTTSALSHFLGSPTLQRCTTALSLEVLRGSKHLDMSFLQNMTRLMELRITRCVDLLNLRVVRGMEGTGNSEITSHVCFHGLSEVSIFGCPKLKELTWLIFSPNLQSLHVRSCNKIEEVICGGGNWSEATEEGGYMNLFPKLQKLWLVNLPQLKSICPNAPPSFPCLDNIFVSGCPNLKEAPTQL